MPGIGAKHSGFKTFNVVTPLTDTRMIGHVARAQLNNARTRPTTA